MIETKLRLLLRQVSVPHRPSLPSVTGASISDGRTVEFGTVNRIPGHDLQNILRQSYDYAKLRLTCDGRLINQILGTIYLQDCRR